MDLERFLAIGVAPRRPDRKDKWQTSPPLPRRAKILENRIDAAGAQMQGGVTDHQHRVVRQALQCSEVGCLSAGRHEIRRDLPDMPTQELQQQMRCPRRRSPQHGGAVQLGERSLTEERHGVDCPVARDREVGEQELRSRVAGILDRRHHTHVEFAGGKQIVELSGCRRHDRLRRRHDTTIHARVDRGGIDPRYPAEPHAACTTGMDARTGRVSPPWGTSNPLKSLRST